MGDMCVSSVAVAASRVPRQASRLTCACASDKALCNCRILSSSAILRLSLLCSFWRGMIRMMLDQVAADKQILSTSGANLEHRNAPWHTRPAGGCTRPAAREALASARGQGSEASKYRLHHEWKTCKRNELRTRRPSSCEACPSRSASNAMAAASTSPCARVDWCKAWAGQIAIELVRVREETERKQSAS